MNNNEEMELPKKIEDPNINLNPDNQLTDQNQVQNNVSSDLNNAQPETTYQQDLHEPTIEVIESAVAPEPVLNDTNIILEKKLIVEEPIKEEKKEGNPIIGFFALLFILGAIVSAFYYFVNQDIIKLPEGVNLPFVKNTSTITNEITTTESNDVDETLTPGTAGVYKEVNNQVCPDDSTLIILNSDNSFFINKLNFNEETNSCEVVPLEGTYSENNNEIILSTSNDSIIANIVNENDEFRINFTLDNINLTLVKISENVN